MIKLYEGFLARFILWMQLSRDQCESRCPPERLALIKLNKIKYKQSKGSQMNFCLFSGEGRPINTFDLITSQEWQSLISKQASSPKGHQVVSRSGETPKVMRCVGGQGRLGSSDSFAVYLSYMNSMKLVIPLHSMYWSIRTKDESKRGSAFAFIFGVNWLWRCGVTASFGVLFHEITGP